MDNLDFYKWLESISSKLGIRKDSFFKIFEYLDKLPDPIIIVETGCLRIKNNFSDGQSTLLFDKYTQSRKKDAKVYTVDIDPKATQVCSENVSDSVSIHTGDSVNYLENLTNNFIKTKTDVSLFYLDSFDCDWKASEQSAQHHLKELVSIKKILKKKTLVVVDDSPIQGYLQQSKIKKNSFDLIPPGLVPGPTISGKGSLIHEYAVHTNAKLLFSSYQTGWIGFNNLD
jgi:hypothetical protein|tara:strand:+ start:1976 stop:2659 length:684 start_codon:yes stop_codon:yes gene_type:complete